MLLTEISILDDVLQSHRPELGADFNAYKNHTYRVVNLCLALSAPAAGEIEKVATATAFHDIGIWTDNTFDYLQPSTRLACTHLSRNGREEWIPEISEMIFQHHKISAYRNHEHLLVEPLRRADLVDVSMGLITFGLPRKLVNEINATWPSAGFHKRLVQLGVNRLLTHPWNPLPMVRL